MRTRHTGHIALLLAFSGLLAFGGWFTATTEAQSSGAWITAILDAGDLSGFDTGAPEGGLLLIRGSGFSAVQDNRVRFIYARMGQNESVEVDPLYCTVVGEEDALVLTAPIGIEPDVNGLGFASLAVSVTADGVPGANSAELRFRPAAAPELTGCSPASGGGGTLLTIEGSQLGSFGLQPTVTFESAGSPPALSSFPAITTGNRIFVLAPDGLPDGPVTVRVQVPGEAEVTCPGFFEYRIDPTPQVVAVLPSAGTPGSIVTIEGTNLANGTEPTVTFGVDPALVIAWSDALILTEVPRSAGAGVREIIVDRGGQSNSPGQAFFTVLLPGSPSIDSIASPSGATAVPPGLPVLLEGSFLGNASYPPQVRFGTALAHSVPFGEDRALAIVPYGLESGLADVSVRVVREGQEATGVALEGIEILAAAPPTLFGVYPETGAPPNGDVLVVGTGFGGPEAEVTVQFTRGGEDVSPAQVITHTRGTIRAVVPSDAISGPVEISVEGSDPAVLTSYPIVPAPEPSIDADASDDQGLRGQTIRLRGEGLWLFGQTPTVTFIGVSGSATAVAPIRSSTDLFVVVPEDAESGPITITVTVASTTSNGIPFTVED